MIALPRTNTDAAFFLGIVDTLPEQIAVIDGDGNIEWVNDSWLAFYRENGGRETTDWRGLSYIGACAPSNAKDDVGIDDLVVSFRAVLTGEMAQFEFEYPCHSPTEQRWFVMTVTPMYVNGTRHFLVRHRNVTRRKLVEEKLLQMASTDGLTGLCNRGYFDQQFDLEWRRAERNGQPISLIFLDIDFFKQLNDQLGHVEGDRCLMRVAGAIGHFARRPGDLAARFGGDEFVLLLSATPAEAALAVARAIQADIERLSIPVTTMAKDGRVTLSIGVAALTPDAGWEKVDLLTAADTALIDAKRQGRNCLRLADVVRRSDDRDRRQQVG
jgi:diguanylate cyclase (GGDEF)-like protein